VLRVPVEVIDQAAAAAHKVGLPAEFAVLARAGLILIGSGAVSNDDLVWALERAQLRAGWPPREDRPA
jgi:hypothetical protein